MQGEAIRETPRIAVDLARFDRRTRVQQAIAADDVRTAPRAVPRPRAEAKTRAQGITLGIRPSSVLLFLYFMGIILWIVFSYAQVSSAARENVRLSNELKKAVKESAVLAAEFESKIKLDEITEIATGRLGMVKLDLRQISYINMAGEEKVEIFDDSITLAMIKNKLAEAFSGLLEYFG